MALILTQAIASLLIGEIVAQVGPAHFRINKCCPRNYELDAEFDCSQIISKNSESSSNGSNSDDFSWFPFDAIVDSKTLKIHVHEMENYRETIRRKYLVNYGMAPECGDADSKELSYHSAEKIEWFNFVMDEGGEMKAYVTKRSSFHDPDSSILNFRRISNDSEAMPSYQNYDSLRMLPLEDTCVDIREQSIHILMYCPCRTMVCIRKCCAEGHHFSIESFNCIENRHEFPDPPFSNWRPKMEGAIGNYYLLSDTYPSCESPFLLKNQDTAYSYCNVYNRASDNDFTIFSNGSLKVRKYKTLFNTSQYCGEVTVSENGTIEEQNIIMCRGGAKEPEDSYAQIKQTLYGVLLVVGGICLLLTIAVFLYLPHLRRKIPNKIALSHNASLMVANFCLAVPQLSTGLSQKTCTVLTLIQHFGFLSSFFWLNVMCIDISMTFSSNRHLKSGRFNGGTKKFTYYCIYAWGSAGLLSVATVAMEFLPGAHLDYLKPGFTCLCGFNLENISMLIYFYGPITILLLTNLVLFVYTSIKIMIIQRQTSVLHKTDSNTTGGSSFQTDKQRYDLIQWLILYGKLFLLMGITWIMEVISWAVGGPSYYWYFFDILNLLRAVFIFILFICKRQVLKSIRKKWSGESQTTSEKTNSGKSQTDVVAFSSTTPDNRPRGSIVSNKSKSSLRSESDFPRTARFKPTMNPSPPVKESSM